MMIFLKWLINAFYCALFKRKHLRLLSVDTFEQEIFTGRTINSSGEELYVLNEAETSLWESSLLVINKEHLLWK